MLRRARPSLWGRWPSAAKPDEVAAAGAQAMVLAQRKQSPAFNPRGTVVDSSGSHVAGMLRRAKPSPSGEGGRAQQRRMRSPQQGRRRWFSPNTSSPPRSTREGLLHIRPATMSLGCFAAQGRMRSFPLRGFGPVGYAIAFPWGSLNLPFPWRRASRPETLAFLGEWRGRWAAATSLRRGAAPAPRKGFHPLTRFRWRDSLWLRVIDPNLP